MKKKHFEIINETNKTTNHVIGMNAVFRFEDILGNSAKLRKAINVAKISATTPSNVMLLGESGTGKELFAHAIHNHSHRSNGPKKIDVRIIAATNKDLIASIKIPYQSHHLIYPASNIMHKLFFPSKLVNENL